MRRALLAIALTLAGCGESPWLHLPAQTQTLRVIKIVPPKRMYVTMMDVESGTIYGPIFISKWCSNWKRIPEGSEFPVTMLVWQNKHTGEVAVEPEIAELTHRFCD